MIQCTQLHMALIRTVTHSLFTLVFCPYYAPERMVTCRQARTHSTTAAASCSLKGADSSGLL